MNRRLQAAEQKMPMPETKSLWAELCNWMTVSELKQMRSIAQRALDNGGQVLQADSEDCARLALAAWQRRATGTRPQSGVVAG